MRRWRYLARDRSGKRAAGEVEALNMAAASDQLSAGGLTPIRLTPIEGRGEVKLTFARGARLARELARLSASGIPLESALAMSAAAEPHRPTRSALERGARRLSEGAGPAEALSRLGGPAGQVIAAAMRAGERSGGLSAALASVAPILEATSRFQGRMVSLSLYPLAVGLTSIGVLIVFFTIVIPSLRPVIEQAEGPSGASWLLTVADTVPAVLIVLLLANLGFFLLTRFPAIRARIGRVRDRLLLGPFGLGLASEIDAALFARLYGALLIAGAPVAEGLEEAARAMGNAIRRGALVRAAEAVREGRPAVSALSGVFGSQHLLVSAAAIGTETGELGTMIAEAGAVMSERAESGLERVSAIASPAIIVGLGAVIGGLVIALFQALSTIPQSLSGGV